VRNLHLFEASSTIILFTMFGKMLESKAKSKALFQISNLAKLQIPTTNLFIPSDNNINFSGKIINNIPKKSVNIDDIIIIKDSEKIPIDGKII
jgi:cation transport ATPase